MCTVSFIARESGFLIGMNRDERLTRPAALGPKRSEREGVAAVYPHEAGGGTWIAVNSHGEALALLNWNNGVARRNRSRGELIPELLHLESFTDAQRWMRAADLRDISPFRLVMASNASRELYEWRWNGSKLSRREFAWQRQFWFSSGAGDEAAAAGRGAAITNAMESGNVDSPEWLRGLHSSHLPDRGAFSICAHRDDAATVSYTEIQVSPDNAALAYSPGSPCSSDLQKLHFIRA